MAGIILRQGAFVKRRTSVIITTMNRHLFLKPGPGDWLDRPAFYGIGAYLPRPPSPAKVAPQVWEATASSGEAEFLVILAEQADLSAAANMPNREARLRYVYDTLRETALRSQASLRAELDRAGVDYRSFYVANLLLVQGDRALVTRLAARSDVARIGANPRVRQSLPEPQSDIARLLAPQGIEWGVARVNADDVWALGYTGQNIVVAGQDTGYDWDHPALINQYRGWDGVTATHDYNWHDAIHSGGGVLRGRFRRTLRRPRPRHPHDGHHRRRRRRGQPDRRGARRALDRLPEYGSGSRHPCDLHRVLRVLPGPLSHRRRPHHGRRPQPGPSRDQQLLDLPT